MKIAFLLIATLVLSSCATSRSNKIKNIDDTIQKCKTTKKELIENWGEPDEVGSQSGFKTLKFEGYKFFLHVPIKDQTAIIFLNQDNIVVDYALNPQGTIIELKDSCSKK